MNPRRYVAPVMEKTIKLASDGALVATQIVQDIENYSTNVIGSYIMIMAQEFLILMVCYKPPMVQI